GHAAVYDNEAPGDAASAFAGADGGAVGKLGIAFAVGDGDRHARADHAAEEDRRRGLDLDHGDPRFELLGAVTHEARAVVAAGDQFAQVGQHLTAVAHTQGEGVGAGEEVAEGLAGLFIEQDRLGPTFTGAQHVTVGEAATGDQTTEVGQIDAATEDVAHVHVDGGEAGAGEGCGHFHLTVDA